MARKKKIRVIRDDVEIEKEYFEEVTVTDPDTGEKITQKVKIIKYKSRSSFKDINEVKSKSIQDDIFEL